MSPVNGRRWPRRLAGRQSGYTQHDELQRQSAVYCCASWRRRDFGRCWMPAAARRHSRYWREAGSVVTALDLSAGMLEARAQQAAALSAGGY